MRRRRLGEENAGARQFVVRASGIGGGEVTSAPLGAGGLATMNMWRFGKPPLGCGGEQHRININEGQKVFFGWFSHPQGTNGLIPLVAHLVTLFRSVGTKR